MKNWQQILMLAIYVIVSKVVAWDYVGFQHHVVFCLMLLVLLTQDIVVTINGRFK